MVSFRPLFLAFLAMSALGAEGTLEHFHKSLRHDPYYHRKTGFKTSAEAALHAHREFLKLARQGAIDPRTREYFSYVYTILHSTTGRVIYFHSAWTPASYLKTENGGEQWAVQAPIVESEFIRKNIMLHSHPTSNPDGKGPSRFDVAVASRYRKAGGGFRYLYLVNSEMKLVRFKAKREIDPGNASALLAMPVRPRRGLDWVD
jgi:hypothetical protein